MQNNVICALLFTAIIFSYSARAEDNAKIEIKTDAVKTAEAPVANKTTVSKPVTTAAATASPKAVEISAAGSLEWDRNKKSYTAKQGVIVKQDNVKIECDTLVAKYSDEKAVGDIKQLEAMSHVTITSAPYTAHGDEAIYNVLTGMATLTGDKVFVDSETGDKMTADQRIEFSKADNKITAVGSPVIKYQGNTIKAQSMSAYFKNDETTGKMIADRMEATGGVSIDTGKEFVTGDKIVYDNQSRKAVMTGDVTVKKGSDVLKGSKAIVDMNTGISQLLGSSVAKDDKGRVTGTFYPKQQGK